MTDVALRGVDVTLDEQSVHHEGGDLTSNVVRGSWAGRITPGTHHVVITMSVGPQQLTPYGYDHLFRVHTVRDVYVEHAARRVAFQLVETSEITLPIERRLQIDQTEETL